MVADGARDVYAKAALNLASRHATVFALDKFEHQ
jgi:hypothetical protein